MGITITKSMWMLIFKDMAACPEIGSSSLWYLESGQYAQVGGWKTPELQLVSIPNLCGQSLYANKVNWG